MKKIVLAAFAFAFYSLCSAQSDRWQQRIVYNMNVNMNVVTNKFNGTSKIDYYNNSPDTLHRLFFHTYWNAFQANSSMDVRSRELGNIILRKTNDGKEIRDWDGRVRDRILHLAPDEVGYQKVQFVKVNGRNQKLKEHETILEVVLDKPIAPKSKTTLDLNFEAQVPVQIRRSGRDNAEGVRYSMSQWYPKMVEYDYRGWNANPYIAREFYGVWGDFNVTINIDKSYMVAATGVLQNANQIGKGYGVINVAQTNTSTNSWKFVANNVHDFVWAADPNYEHLLKKVRSDLTLHVFYKKKDASTDSAWNNVLWAAEKALPYMEKRFGKYPWPQYSFIQGGDGGMEYAMATLVKGPGLGTVFHEWMHSWYQHLLGTNESLYPWMDEGFTDFAEGEVMNYYLKNWANQSPYINDAVKTWNTKAIADAETKLPAVQADSYNSYSNLAKSPFAEPLTTHADHYNSNYGYSINSYSKGSVYLSQLGYIIGDKVRDKVLLAYYNEWKFKHPNANDFLRVAEKVSGIELQWYNEYWVNTTKTIDYAIDSLWDENGKTNIRIKRVGEMPMPIDVQLTFKDGTKELHNVPLNLMYGTKPAESDTVKRTVHEEWRWTHPTYIFQTDRKLTDLSQVEIDPTQRMADIERRNNLLKISW